MEFKEVQKFNQWWLWLLLAIIGLLPIAGIYIQLIKGEEFGSKPMSDTGLIIFSIFIFLLIGLFLVLRLKTNIDRAGIKMQYVPFVKKNVSWNDVESVEVLDYGFVGGWGIRLWTVYGTVYNVKGSKGVAIKLTNGKKFLIGTQKATELEEVLRKIRQN
ncbi:hypothetical protein U8527_07445 [Kordia algicida OT-1]|uniref:Uncharacterized protein n=1 Tax=Kordia algicida OT-1 TaxID=391587 RepID=A9EDL0_9FLAO|nr:hypothetical protein [Kordia algicida]EDP94246.1 hypothetical protein KAOT1_00860 [Kordia algicida OT-1]